MTVRRWMFEYPGRVVVPELKDGWSNRVEAYAVDYADACCELERVVEGRKTTNGKSLDSGLFQLRSVTDVRNPV